MRRRSRHHTVESMRLLLPVCALALWISASQALAEAAAPQTLPSFLGAPAPAFTLLDTEGKPHQLADYRGQVVVLNFWATWCPPCREEMPAMERLHKMVANESIAVVAINVGEDEDTIFLFTADYPVSFPLLMDQDGSVTQDYPVIGLPTTYIIDPAGIIRHRAVGTREWDDPELVDELRALLTE